MRGGDTNNVFYKDILDLLYNWCNMLCLKKKKIFKNFIFGITYNFKDRETSVICNFHIKEKVFKVLKFSYNTGCTNRCYMSFQSKKKVEVNKKIYYTSYYS